MKLFGKRVTREEMLASVAKARLKFENAPASRAVMDMHAALGRIESLYADGNEPSDTDIKAALEALIDPLDRMSGLRG